MFFENVFKGTSVHGVPTSSPLHLCLRLKVESYLHCLICHLTYTEDISYTNFFVHFMCFMHPSQLQRNMSSSISTFFRELIRCLCHFTSKNPWDFKKQIKVIKFGYKIAFFVQILEKIRFFSNFHT
jgi:hypothetical protein